jgi:hypothetical protein
MGVGALHISDFSGGIRPIGRNSPNAVGGRLPAGRNRCRAETSAAIRNAAESAGRGRALSSRAVSA